MKRHPLFLLAVLIGLVTLCTGTYDGTPSLSGSLKPYSFQRIRDPFTSPSGLRWRQGLPNHWRACLLQR
jgi:hypothetical protein